MYEALILYDDINIHEPNNTVDVYLQPLMKELKGLWEDGLDTYDASKSGTFRMLAVLL